MNALPSRKRTVLMQTGDFHLVQRGDDRWHVLELILALAEEMDVRGILIAGDLFDSTTTADRLKHDVTSLFQNFSNLSFFVIPGDHDRFAYGKQVSLGKNSVILNEQPYSRCTFQNLAFVGVPFSPKQRLIDTIYGIDFQVDDPVVLLVHGTLFDPQHPWIYREIQDRDCEFFSIFWHDLAAMGITYAAIGHVHTRFSVLNRANVIACYAGSPVALHDYEDGPRGVALIEFQEDGQIEVARVTTTGNYFLHKEFWLMPYQERENWQDMENALRKLVDHHCMLMVTIHGISVLPPSEMKHMEDSLSKTMKGQVGSVSITSEVDFFGELFENPMVARFVEEVLHNTANHTPDYRVQTLKLGIKAFRNELVK